MHNLLYPIARVAHLVRKFVYTCLVNMTLGDIDKQGDYDDVILCEGQKGFDTTLLPSFMTPKRKQEDNPEADCLRNLLSSAIITNHGSAEVALLHIMEEYNFSPSLLQEILTRPVILFGLSEAI